MLARGTRPAYGVRRPWRLSRLIEGTLILAAGACTVASAAGFAWIFLFNDPDIGPGGDPAASLSSFTTAAGPAASAAPATRPGAARPTGPAAAAGTVFVAHTDAPLLRLPDRLSGTKRTLQKGQPVERVGQIENWMLVRLVGAGGAGGAVSGWVEARHLAAAE